VGASAAGAAVGAAAAVGASAAGAAVGAAAGTLPPQAASSIHIAANSANMRASEYDRVMAEILSVGGTSESIIGVRIL
jgi:hypothetical protein